MKRAHIHTLAGLAICVIAMILITYKINNDHKNRDHLSATMNNEALSSINPSRGIDDDIARAKQRQRTTRKNLDVLSQMGFLLTADDIGEHTAKGNVQITTPNGTHIIKSDRVSISSDGSNLFLRGNITMKPTIGEKTFSMVSNGPEAFSKISLAGDGKIKFHTKVSVIHATDSLNTHSKPQK